MDEGRQLLESIKEACKGLETVLYPGKEEETRIPDEHLDFIEKGVKDLCPLFRKIEESLEIKARAGYLGLTRNQIRDLEELASLASELVTACSEHVAEELRGR